MNSHSITRSGDSRHQQGFTIIEIMVASMVMALLVTVIVGITANFIKAYNNSSNRLSGSYIARSVLDYLENDLESAVFRNNGDIWMGVNYGSESDQTNGSFTIDQTAGSGIFFFSTPLDSSTPGSLSAMSYQLLRTHPIEGEPQLPPEALALYRHQVSAKETFDQILGSYTNATEFYTKFIFNAASVSERNNAFLAENIHKLIIRFYVDTVPQDAEGVAGPYILYPTGGNYDITFPFEGPYSADNDQNGVADSGGNSGTLQGAPVASPDFIDIELEIVTDELKEQLRAIDQGLIVMDAQAKAELMAQGVETYYRRIQIRSSGL